MDKVPPRSKFQRFDPIWYEPVGPPASYQRTVDFALSTSFKPGSLRDRNELQADRRLDLDRLTGRIKLTGRLINPKNHDRAGPLVGGEEERPVRSTAKLRGVLPPDGWCPTGVSRPVAASMAKMAMLSLPRFEP